MNVGAFPALTPPETIAASWGVLPLAAIPATTAWASAVVSASAVTTATAFAVDTPAEINASSWSCVSVSYTHLTLPTILLV